MNEVYVPTLPAQERLLIDEALRQGQLPTRIICRFRRRIAVRIANGGKPSFTIDAVNAYLDYRTHQQLVEDGILTEPEEPDVDEADEPLEVEAS